MRPENKAFLDANRHHHDTLIKAFYLRSLNNNEREGMQRVMSEEFQPGYATDLWCPPCVSDMVLLLYRSYDEWLAQQAATIIEAIKEPEAPEAVIDTATEELPKEPAVAVQVAANFPSHKNHRRK